MNIRKTLPIVIGLILTLAVFSCNRPAKTQKVSSATSEQKSKENMHQQHINLADNFSHKDIVILEQVYKTAETTEKELEEVIDAYLQIKDALVKDDEQATNKAVDLMYEKVALVIPSKLAGNGLEAWKNHQNLYEQKLKEMKHIKGLENKRSYFSHVSEIVYCTIKSFGIKEGNLYAIFCPMAFDGKGAYWINNSKVVQNPYFGAKMPTCGEIKETL